MTSGGVPRSVKTKVMMVLTESFVPFLGLLLGLVGFLVYIDGIIDQGESRKKTISLSQEVRDLEIDTSISQLMPSHFENGRFSKEIEEINRDISSGKYKKALKRAKKMDLKREGFGGKSREISSKLSAINTSDEANFLISLSFLHFKVGHIKRAIKIISSLPDPTPERGLFNLGLYYSARKKTLKLSISNYQLFIQRGGGSFEAHFNLALVYYKKHRFKMSILHGKKAAEYSRSRRRAKSFYTVGLGYLELSKVKSAQRYFKKSINSFPSYLKPRKKSALITFATDRERGFGELKKIISLDSSYTRGYYFLGTYYLEKKDYFSAIKILKAGLEESPRSNKLLSFLGAVYLESGEYENAKSVYERLLDDFTPKVKYRFNLGRSLMKTKEYERAIAQFDLILRADPKNFKATFNMATAFQKMKKLEDAKNYFEKSIKLNPKKSSIYHNLGLLALTQGQTSLALRHFGKALKNDPRARKSLFKIARIHEQNGKLDAAVQEYRQTISIDPLYVPSYLNLAKIYVKRGDTGQAILLLKSGVSKLGPRLNFRLDEGSENPLEFLPIPMKVIGLNDPVHNVDGTLGFGGEGGGESRQNEHRGSAAAAGIELHHLDGYLKLRNRIGLYLYEQKMYSQSVSAYSGVLRFDKSNKLALLGLGRNYYALRKFEKCEFSLLRYVYMRPTVEEGRYFLMACLFELGKFKESQRHLEIVRRIHPGKYLEVDRFEKALISRLNP